ncbi:MAG: hypothetical protein ACYC7B_03975 [Burkholderiales bacterium]
MISIATAMTLTGLSERTFWRRISDGTFEGKSAKGNKTRVDLATIEPYICIPIKHEDSYLIGSADAGNPEAQTDLALIFLENDRPRGAFYWLELAAQRDFADAMHLLGRCYIDGNGVQKDTNLGIMWIAKAASRGHVLAAAQMQGVSARLPAKPGAASPNPS